MCVLPQQPMTYNSLSLRAISNGEHLFLQHNHGLELFQKFVSHSLRLPAILHSHEPGDLDPK